MVTEIMIVLFAYHKALNFKTIHNVVFGNCVLFKIFDTDFITICYFNSYIDTSITVKQQASKQKKIKQIRPILA